MIIFVAKKITVGGLRVLFRRCSEEALVREGLVMNWAEITLGKFGVGGWPSVRIVRVEW